MTWRLDAEVHDSLPCLFWVADLDLLARTVSVAHGRAVEVGPDFVVEGVWDGPFPAADFDQTSNFFGSGIRFRGDEVWLTPSRALVDRVLYGISDSRVVASNSLAGLMAHAGACLDPKHDYRNESYALLAGIHDFDPSVCFRGGPDLNWNQAFHFPLEVGSGSPRTRAPETPEHFGSFQGYENKLRSVLGAIAENAKDPSRTRQVRIWTTISRGYDSPAVMALVKDLGVEKAFSSLRSNSLIPSWLNQEAVNDDGRPIASLFGVPTAVLLPPREGTTPDEIFYLAPSAAEPELVYKSLMEASEGSPEVTLLFTGYNGDVLWARNPKTKPVDDSVRRGDVSGLNVSEIRLKAGILNVAVPFLFARSHEDLLTITRSQELKPWSVGGKYDRPIARRLAEEAGIPRRSFGLRKRAVVQQYPIPSHPSLRKEFLHHLRDQHGLSALSVRWRIAMDRFVFVAWRAAEKMLSLAGVNLKAPPARPLLSGRYDLPYFMHLWALAKLKGWYEERLP